MHIPEDISEMIANKNLSELMTASLSSSSSTHRPTTTSDGKQTSRRRLLAPQQTETPSTSNSLNLNFHNSVVVVSIASAILVVFGLACFSISMLLYFTSKCGRKRREEKKRREPQNSGGDFMSSSETKIVVYDMPSAAAALKENNQKQTVYSLASTLSSTSECGDTSASSSSTTNNISPVTTTTTSIQGSSSSNSNAHGSCSSAAGPLFQTHLETNTAQTNVLTGSLSNMQNQLPLPPNLPDLPKTNIFDWFMEQNAQSCEFSRVNHIK